MTDEATGDVTGWSDSTPIAGYTLTSWLVGMALLAVDSTPYDWRPWRWVVSVRTFHGYYPIATGGADSCEEAKTLAVEYAHRLAAEISAVLA